MADAVAESMMVMGVWCFHFASNVYDAHVSDSFSAPCFHVSAHKAAC